VRVLVTGATGFIARHTLPALRARGWEVHAACRHPEALPPDAARGHAIDLLDPVAVDRLLAAVRPAALLHLAWKPLTGGAAAETEEESRPWLEASTHLARAFARQGGRRLVGIGSGAEYRWDGTPCREDVTPTEPATPYGRVKHALHQKLAAVAAETGLSLAWARVFFLYGPHESPRRLVPAAILAALRGEEARFGPGLSQRDYLHAADAGAALAALAAGAAEGAFNVGSGAAIALRDLAEQAHRLAGGGGQLRFAPAPPAPDPQDRVEADTTRLRAATGWAPSIALAEGLRDCVAWWRGHLPAPLSP
jgi:nucleoside-diphosphate-sugar epimerase